MTALAQRRMVGITAILFLLFTLQAVVYAPAVGAEDTCQKVEDADLGVEGLEITIDGHVDVTFTDWVGSANEYSAVTIHVSGLLENEDLVWRTKAGSAAGGTLEANEGVITEDGTYTIGRAVDAFRGISYITLCVVDVPTTESARLVVTKEVVVQSGEPQTTVFGFEITDRPDFTLVDSATAVFVHELGDSATITVTVVEKPIVESGWTTTIVCGDGAGGTVTLEAGDAVTCVVTNTYRAEGTTTTSTTTTSSTTTTTTVPTTNTTATTTTIPTSTTTTDGAVLGTTITAPPEVTSETLPFTGAGTGSLAVIGLVALILGVVTLRLGHREIDERGEWSAS